MGYSVFLLQAPFHISSDNFSEAFLAAKRLVPYKNATGKLKPHFAFVEEESVNNAQSLHDLMCAWRWCPEYDDEDNMIGLEFLGEKLGDEDELFQAIAPFVGNGSEIRMAGEDGRIWRWLFENSRVKKQEGAIIFS